MLKNLPFQQKKKRICSSYVFYWYAHCVTSNCYRHLYSCSIEEFYTGNQNWNENDREETEWEEEQKFKYNNSSVSILNYTWGRIWLWMNE